MEEVKALLYSLRSYSHSKRRHSFMHGVCHHSLSRINKDVKAPKRK